MILVVNLNPSLDKIYTVAQLKYGGVVRAEHVHNTAGGKGTHVASVVHILGEDCAVTGFLGGSIGEFIANVFKSKNITDASIKIAKETRSCMNIATSDGKQTEVLEPGPYISEAEQAEFIAKYTALLAGADVVVASGSLPQNVAVDFYKRLIELAHRAGKPFLLDTSGQALVEGIQAKPYFIKPNKDEVEMLTGEKITGIADAVRCVKQFAKLGIKMPCISLGKDGAVLYFAGTIYRVKPPALKEVNAVGSGDSFVAGMAVGLKRDLPAADLLKLAASCGTANVMEAESGFVRKSEVERLRQAVDVESIESFCGSVVSSFD